MSTQIILSSWDVDVDVPWTHQNVRDADMSVVAPVAAPSNGLVKSSRHTNRLPSLLRGRNSHGSSAGIRHTGVLLCRIRRGGGDPSIMWSRHGKSRDHADKNAKELCET